MMPHPESVINEEVISHIKSLAADYSRVRNIDPEKVTFDIKAYPVGENWNIYLILHAEETIGSVFFDGEKVTVSFYYSEVKGVFN